MSEFDAVTLEALPDGIVVADAEGRVVACNRVAARLLGRPAAELIGTDYRAALPLVDSRGRVWWDCVRPYDGLDIRRGQPERLLETVDGTELLVTAAFHRDAQDRSQVRALVVSLRGTASRARQERDRAELVSTLSHELRSPLTSVKGFTATLLAKWDRFTDDQKKLMLETVNTDADRVTRLIGDLLDVSRIDAGRLQLRKQVVDLGALAEQVLHGQVAGGHAPEQFVLDRDGELPELWADPDKMAQVLRNLVENAVRHGAGTVTVRLRPAEGGCELTVEDEGEGVADEVAGRIFTKFWRHSERGGTGLGLFIVKGLVEAHGGSVSVGHGAAGGARFSVRLPSGQPVYS